MKLTKLALATALAGAAAMAALPASAQTVKIGLLTTYSGLNANLGEYMERAMKLYMKLNDKTLPPGVKIELVIRDDTGANPDKAKQLTQELIGPGDITTDEELPNMGDVALGVVTAHHYSAAADRPANKAFVAAWKKEYGAKETPNFVAVGAWDATDAIFHVIREQKGKIDPDRTMELPKNYKNANSPRGPIAIDPATRDIVQNEYLREVRKVNGQLANVEIETIGTAVKDPWKEFNSKK